MHHRDFNGDHAERVTVRRCLRDRAMSDNAIAARAIDDIDGLTQVLFEVRAEETRNSVGSSARAPWHDQRDRALGIGRDRGSNSQCNGERGNRAQPALHGFLLASRCATLGATLIRATSGGDRRDVSSAASTGQAARPPARRPRT